MSGRGLKLSLSHRLASLCFSDSRDVPSIKNKHCHTTVGVLLVFDSTETFLSYCWLKLTILSMRKTDSDRLIWHFHILKGVHVFLGIILLMTILSGIWNIQLPIYWTRNKVKLQLRVCHIHHSSNDSNSGSLHKPDRPSTFSAAV